MGQFVNFENLSTSSGSGSEDVNVYGVLALVDIVPVDSSSFDITISRVLPDGELAEIYAATGVTAQTTLQRSDLNQSSLELAGPVRVALANAGNHDDAVHVYLTVL